MPSAPDRDGAMTDAAATGRAPETASAKVMLTVMLHARPAALLAREVGNHSAQVTVDGADAASVLALMRLGAMPGQRLEVAARGPGAPEAVAALVRIIAEGMAGADVHPG